MNRRHSFSFLLEYVIAVAIFALASAICVSIFASAYEKNDIDNHKREALEVMTSYIENGDCRLGSFATDDITYIVKSNSEGFEHFEIFAYYKNKELFSLEFGGGHEKN